MADGNIVSSSIPELFTKVRGEVIESRGDVFLIRASGEEVLVQKGDKIYLNDTLSSHNDSAVVVMVGNSGVITLGQDQQLPFTQAFFDKADSIEEVGSLEDSISIEALEQAIADGQSIEELLQAPAAGPEDIQEGSQNALFYQRTGDALLPVSGFETTTFSIPTDDLINQVGDLDNNNNLNGIERPPIANAVVALTDENSVVDGTVSASDEDGTVVEFALDTPPSLGELTFNEDGSFSFDPGTDFDDLPLGATTEVTFTYTATDDDGNISEPATVTLTITGLNDDPLAVDDEAVTQEDTPLVSTINLSSNDTDLDGDELSVTAGTFTTAEGGEIVVAEDGSYTYTPAQDFNGTDSIEYTVTDGNDAFDSATLTITVTPVNDAPLAVDDAITATEDTPFVSVVDLVANDNDLDGDALSVVAGTFPTTAGGSIVISEDGSYTYTPPENFTGDDTVDYTVTDGELTDTGTLSITVAPANDAPVAEDDSITVTEDTPFSSVVELDANDTDLDGDALSVVAGTFPTTGGGEIVISEDGSYTYTPAPNFTGTDTVDYTVTDGELSDVGTLTITVEPVNDAPVVSSNAITVAEDSDDTSLGLTAPTDVDGDPLAITVTGLPTLGSVTLADGTPVVEGQVLTPAELEGLQYDAPEDYDGADPGDFTYSVDDGQGTPESVQTGTVDITVTPVNDAPVVSSNTITVAEDSDDTSLGLTAPTDVDGDPLAITVTGLPTLGLVTLDDTPVVEGQVLTPEELEGLQYDAPDDYDGADPGDFTYSVDDGQGTPVSVQTGTVDITVTPVNDAPVVSSNAITVAEDSDDTSLGLTAPTDVDGDPLAITVTGLPTLGSVTLADGTPVVEGQVLTPAELEGLQYDAPDDYDGADPGDFTYSVDDGQGTPVSVQTGTVDITVTPVNDAPVNTVPASLAVDEDTPIGFAGENLISVTDVDGNLASTQLTVTNGVLNVTLSGDATISAGANGSDTLTISGTEAEINETLASLTYQGDADFNGEDSLTVVSTDSGGVPLSDTDVVLIEVSPINDAPVNTVPASLAVDEDTPIGFAGENLISVTDVDGNLASTQLTVTNGVLNVTLSGDATISAGANGSDTLTISGTEAEINETLASLTYQGDADFNGEDSLTVVSTDSGGVALSDTDVVLIEVSPINDAPVNTVPASLAVDEDTPIGFAGENLISVTDVDGNLASTQLTVTNGVLNVTLSGDATISAGANGSDTLTISGTEAEINETLASLTYQGDADFNGEDSLTVVSTDSGGVPLSDTDVVLIEVSPINDAPVNTVPASLAVDEDTPIGFAGENLISVTDVDGNLASTQLTVTNGVLNVTLSGDATISAGANGSDTLTISGTEAEINETLASLTYQGDADFNGEDSLTVVSTDSGGVPLSDTDVVLIEVSPINDAPVNTVPASLAVDEDTPIGFAGENLISVTDVDGNLASTQLTVTNGVLNVTLSGDATISAGANGSDTLTISGTEAEINETLASLTYQGDADFNGEDSLTVVSTDSGGVPLSDTDVVLIEVSPINDAPVNTVPASLAVDEDTPIGFAGENLISVTDVDGNLASTQLTVTNGVLNVTLSGDATISAGANGSDTLTISGTEAEINETLASLTYQGDADFNGEDSLTVVSTDSGGVPLSDTDVVLIEVSPINDAPVNTVPASLAVDEDTPIGFAGENLISVTDVDGNLASTQLTVTNGVLNVTLSGDATISAGANGSDTLTISGTEAEINETLASLTYQGDADFNGEDSLTVVSTDSGGVPLSDTDVVLIEVSPINDAPVNTVPASLAVDEDTPIGFAGENLISVTDVDGNLASTQLTVTNGVLNVTLSGDATISAGANDSDTLTISGTEAEINETLASLTYQGDADFNGEDSLTVVSTDSGGVALSDTDVVLIEVSPINDAPVNTVPASLAVDEDTPIGFAGENLISVTDVDGNLASTQLTVTNGVLNVTLSGDATISAGANGSDTLTISGTEAEINETLASLTYQGDADFNGEDSLTVVSTDSGGVPLSDTDVVLIEVSPINDAPVNTVPASLAVDEDTPIGFAGENLISVTDVDGNLASTQLTVTNGVLNVTLSGDATISAGANGSDTLTISGTEAEINETLASLTYQGDADFNGEDSLTVVSTDSGGVPLSDTDVVLIEVSPINDAPVNTVPASLAVDEDTPIGFAGENLISVTDVDGNLASTQLTVTNGVLNVTLSGDATISAGANGSDTLTISGTEAEINETLASLTYQGDADFNGEDSLTVVSTDSGGVPLSDTDVVLIEVSPINDAPVNTVPASLAVDEDTPIGFAGENLISVTDVDGNLASTQLTVTNGVLNVTLSGDATISAGANDSDTLTISGTEAEINETLASLTYQGDADFNGEDSLTVVSTDSGGVPLSDTDVVTIDVTPVSDTGYVRITQSTSTVGEGEAVTYTVEIMDGPGVDASPLIVPPGELVTVSLNYGGDATPVDDYDVSGGSLLSEVQIIAGASSTSFTVTAIDDLIAEGNETITVSVGTVSNDSGAIDEFLGHPEDSVSTAIIDNDIIGVAGVSSDEAFEGETLVHTVSLSVESTEVETFDFELEPGNEDFLAGDYGTITFSEGVTFTETSSLPDGTLIGTLSVPVGVVEFTISVPATDDIVNEETEAYSISVDSVSGTGTILDTDVPLLIDDDTGTVFESGLPGGTDEGSSTAPTVITGNLLANDENPSIDDVFVDINGITPDSDGVITLTSTTIDPSGATVELGTLVVYTTDFDGNSAGDYTYTLINPSADNDTGAVLEDTFTYTMASGNDPSGSPLTASADLVVTIIDQNDAPVILTTDQTQIETQTTTEELFEGGEIPVGGEIEDANGIDPATNLTLDSVSNVTVSFVSESAGFNSIVGYYQIDPSGNIQNPSVAWGNTNEASGSRTFFNVPEGEVGFFLVANGANGRNAAILEDESQGIGFFGFENPAGEPATADDDGATLFYYSSEGAEGVRIGTTYHASYSNLNPDDLNHVRSGTIGDDDSVLQIGFEDLPGTRADWDLEDFVFNVEIDSVDSSVVAINPDITISDVDSTMLSAASIVISSGEATDSLILNETLADELGIDYTYDAANQALNLSGDASLTDYEAVLESVQLSSPVSLGNDVREFEYTVTDDQGLSSSLGTVSLNVVSPDLLTEGTSGDDILVGTAAVDLIVGHGGDDILTGGGSTDIFSFDASDADDSTDRITDFVAGSGGDVLDFSDLLSGESATAESLDEYLTISISPSGANTTIEIDDNGADAGGGSNTIILEGVDLSTISGVDTNQGMIDYLLSNGNLNVDP